MKHTDGHSCQLYGLPCRNSQQNRQKQPCLCKDRIGSQHCHIGKDKLLGLMRKHQHMFQFHSVIFGRKCLQHYAGCKGAYHQDSYRCRNLHLKACDIQPPKYDHIHQKCPGQPLVFCPKQFFCKGFTCHFHHAEPPGYPRH